MNKKISSVAGFPLQICAKTWAILSTCCKMTQFPLICVLWQEHVFFFGVKSFQRSVAVDVLNFGRFYSIATTALASNCHSSCRGFFSPLYVSVREFSIISSVIFAMEVPHHHFCLGVLIHACISLPLPKRTAPYHVSLCVYVMWPVNAKKKRSHCSFSRHVFFPKYHLMRDFFWGIFKTDVLGTFSICNLRLHNFKVNGNAGEKEMCKTFNLFFIKKKNDWGTTAELQCEALYT